jgi:hypothetical protein
MVWVELAESFDYRFLPSGELQYRDRTGQYRITGGVTPHGYHTFWDRLERLNGLVDERPGGVTIHQLFVTSDVFAFEAEQCIELSGIKPEWVGIEQRVWLLFSRRDDDGNLHVAPLQVLNSLPEPRRPVSGKGEPLTDRVKFLAAISAQCDSIGEAYGIATSQPAREVLSVMEERAWQSMDAKERHEAGLKEWAEKRRKHLAQRAGKRPPAGGNP